MHKTFFLSSKFNKSFDMYSNRLNNNSVYVKYLCHVNSVLYSLLKQSLNLNIIMLHRITNNSGSFMSSDWQMH